MAQRRPTHDPYEVLGLDRRVTADDVKRARRRKSRSSHPDAGGSHQEQAEVNAAYEILADPARRLLYDQTGVDSTDTVGDEAASLLEQMFAAGLNSNAPDLLAYARQQLDAHESKIKAERMKATDARARFEARRDRYTVRDGAPNLIHRIIDLHLVDIDRHLHVYARQLDVVHEARAALDHYESAEPRMLPAHTYRTYTLRDLYTDTRGYTG